MELLIRQYFEEYEAGGYEAEIFHKKEQQSVPIMVTDDTSSFHE